MINDMTRFGFRFPIRFVYSCTHNKQYNSLIKVHHNFLSFVYLFLRSSWLQIIMGAPRWEWLMPYWMNESYMKYTGRKAALDEFFVESSRYKGSRFWTNRWRSFFDIYKCLKRFYLTDISYKLLSLKDVSFAIDFINWKRL